ncbi:MAG TPA: HAD-IIA family hydrolase [Polyangiaceae bacterium]
MERYALYILDLDGTLYRGEEPLPAAREALAALRAHGSRVRFLTNNSTRRPEEYAAKLSKMGFQAAPHEMYTSAMAAAETLRGSARSAMVVGEEGLVSALERAGVTTGGDRPDAVVVGLCRTFDYAMMSQAMQHLLRPDVRFVATNGDLTFPLEGGRLIPGSGAIVRAIASCAGREPEVVGKPNPYAIECILREAGVAAADTLVVGDRMETDIAAGRRAGCAVHLVLTGVTRSAPEGVPWSEDLSVL